MGMRRTKPPRMLKLRRSITGLCRKKVMLALGPSLALLCWLHCKANPDFSLAVVPGQGPAMRHTDPDDDFQIWYKDETISTRVKDETGSSAFSLINKATGQALRHAPEDLKQCLLVKYEPNGYDE